MPKTHAQFTICIAALCAGLPARAGFVAGRIYVAEMSAEICPEPAEPLSRDRIWQVDPVTQQVQLFVTIPESLCGQISGLTFTPDGRYLRTTNYWDSTVLEIDGSGNVALALNSSNGIYGPDGSNCVAYDILRNFFVVQQGAHNIRRFPPGDGAGMVFAYAPSGGSVAIVPGGDVYYGGLVSPIQRFSASGEPIGTISLPANTYLKSLAVDSAGNVYAMLTGRMLYRYALGDPASQQLLAVLPSNSLPWAITVSPDDATIYVASQYHQVFAVDATTGTFATVGTIPAVYGLVGSGIAFYRGLAGDCNADGELDLSDVALAVECLTGPSGGVAPLCECANPNSDLGVDLLDFAVIQSAFGP